MDIAPSEHGERVEPKISEELIKRIQAAEKVKTRKEIKKEYDPVYFYSCSTFFTLVVNQILGRHILALNALKY